MIPHARDACHPVISWWRWFFRPCAFRRTENRLHSRFLPGSACCLMSPNSHHRKWQTWYGKWPLFIWRPSGCGSQLILKIARKQKHFWIGTQSLHYRDEIRMECVTSFPEPETDRLSPYKVHSHTNPVSILKCITNRWSCRGVQVFPISLGRRHLICFKFKPLVMAQHKQSTLW